MDVMKETYVVEPSKDKKDPGWVVKCPDGVIANSFVHKTEVAANKHCAYCNAFFGS